MSLAALVVALAAAQVPPARSRPRDPWVFRSVLDEKPRMVTFALNDEMWVAYDATTCALYKAWKGGVHCDGAVYTTVHGPQPTSEGTSYTDGTDGTDGSGGSGGPGGTGGAAWEVFVGDKLVDSKPRWKGYVFHDGRCTMNFELELPDGRRVGVLETPEFARPEDLFQDEEIESWVLKRGAPGLLRSFLVSEIPDDVKIALRVRTDGATSKLCELEERATTEEKGGATRAYTHVVLNAGKRMNNLILFFAPMAAAKPGDAAKPADAAKPGQPAKDGDKK
jgi:cytochrome c